MITWGEEYVSALDVNHCPLCKSEFNSVAALLGQIRAEKKAVFKVTQLKENIDSLAVTRGKLTDENELNKLVVERYLPRNQRYVVMRWTPYIKKVIY